MSSTVRHGSEKYGFLITDSRDVLLMDQNEPTTYQEVMLGPDSEKLAQSHEI